MFNMTKIRASHGSGKSFYANHLSANDYYSEHEKITGHWRGELAEVFGLRGNLVTSEEFSLFQKNINPKTYGKLTQKNIPGGPRFFDFQCAAPKSVSVMSLFDERLMEAHVESVRIAMSELEKFAAVRVRHGENVRTNNYETTGQLIYAEFTHDTSRELDPQLHTHNVVCNVTRSHDGKFKALETLEMCRAIRYAGKVYHNAMALKCRELGYDTVNVRDKKENIVWYDLKCVPDEIMERFSKRRIQIEKAETEFIAQHGRKPTLSENNDLSLSTRSGKMKNSTKEKVREFQFGQLSHQEEEELYAAVKYAKARGTLACILGREETVEQLRKVLEELYERESVLKQDKLLAEVLNRNLGKVDLEVLKESIQEVRELRNLGGDDANPYYAPEAVIERELLAIDSVDQQRDIFKAIAPEFVAFAGDKSHKKQAELIHGLLSSKDRFNLFRGVAGAGKTSTLQEFCKGLRSGGVENIVLVAPTNSATDVLKQEGFEQSQTVASFLLSPQKPPAKSYVIIDESGLNSLREGVEILKLARRNNYRVLFVGDARQHTAVESGDFFRLLEDYSQIQKFSLTEIHRQRNEEYRRGIFECAMGQYEQAFERFDKQHFIHDGKQNYLNEAAEQYMTYTEQGQYLNRAILVAPTHEECDKLTDAVREKLKKRQAIHGAGREMEVFRSWNKPKAWLKDASNFPPGMTIGFIRNMKGIGKAGEVTRIEAVDGKQLVLANGKRIFAKNASDFIDVGETRKIELCAGDLIQFRANRKELKIYNGTLARISRKYGYVDLLDAGGKVRRSIPFPEHYAAFDYGWVTTSHKSQGRTAENVVVAAESLDRKAFYVALSRGRDEMSLHCPDKEYLRRSLARRTGERTSIHDLIRNREIPPNALLPLSEKIRAQKAKILPDFSYKDIAKRTKTALRKVKAMLNDAAAIRRMRKHRERLFNEHTHFETEEPAVGLIGKVMGKITGLFKKSEVVPEPTDATAREHVQDAEQEQERETARILERKALWKVFEEAWSDYIEKRKEYHTLHGGGEVFELTDREKRFHQEQLSRRSREESPEPLPFWMENWRETAESEAQKSRDVLIKHLAEEKRQELDKLWNIAEKQWDELISSRKKFYEERYFGTEFRLWPEEEAFVQAQAERRAGGLEPEAIPVELQNWRERAEDEVRRLIEEQKRDLLAKWKNADLRWENYLAERQAYQDEFYSGRKYELSSEEQQFVQQQKLRRRHDLKPEIPEWLDNWRQKADALRQREYESEAQWKWKWKNSDEAWGVYRSGRKKLSTSESAYQRLVEQRRNAHKLPPEYQQLPEWMRTEEVLEIYRRQHTVEEIRNALGIHPGDEDQVANPNRKTYYESRKAELAERIAEYDRNVILEKLPEWMKERNPGKELKEKIRNGIYLKYRCHVENEKSLSSMDWLELQKRKLKAKTEYETYEQWLRIPPATQKQIAELEDFVEAAYLDSYPDDLNQEEAENLLRELREEEKRQALEKERRLHPVEKWTLRTLEALYQAGRLKKLPEGICEREARELINEITEHDPANEFEKGQIRRTIRDGFLPHSVEKRLANLTQGEYRELLAQAQNVRKAAALERERREQEHPRQVSRDRGGMEC